MPHTPEHKKSSLLPALPKIRLNPDFRHKSMHVYSAAIAGPALMYAGVKFPGSTASRVALTAAGAFLIYTHHTMLKEMLAGGASNKSANKMSVKQLASGAGTGVTSSSSPPLRLEEFPDLTPEEAKEIDESAINSPEFSIFDSGTVRGEGPQEDLGFDIKDFAGFFK